MCIYLRLQITSNCIMRNTLSTFPFVTNTLDWKPVDSGFSCALDLVKYLREKEGDWFDISIAGYPEGHPQRISNVADWGREMSAAEAARASTADDGTIHCCSDEDYQKELDYLKVRSSG